MTRPTEFALRLVKQGFLQARPLSGIGFLTMLLPLFTSVYLLERWVNAASNYL